MRSARARLAVLVFVWMSGSSGILAAEPPNPAIEAAIVRQLDAFNRGDSDAAFAVAAPTIQSLFSDAATFMGMVERGFRPLYKSASHRFLNLDTSEGRPIQRVLVNGADGSTVVARYEMIEVDGRWRIAGCSLEKGTSA